MEMKKLETSLTLIQRRSSRKLTTLIKLTLFLALLDNYKMKKVSSSSPLAEKFNILLKRLLNLIVVFKSSD